MVDFNWKSWNANLRMLKLHLSRHKSWGVWAVTGLSVHASWPRQWLSQALATYCLLYWIHWMRAKPLYSVKEWMSCRRHWSQRLRSIGCCCRSALLQVPMLRSQLPRAYTRDQGASWGKTGCGGSYRHPNPKTDPCWICKQLGHWVQCNQWSNARSWPLNRPTLRVFLTHSPLFQLWSRQLGVPGQERLGISLMLQAVYLVEHRHQARILYCPLSDSRECNNRLSVNWNSAFNIIHDLQ